MRTRWSLLHPTGELMRRRQNRSVGSRRRRRGFVADRRSTIEPGSTVRSLVVDSGRRSRQRSLAGRRSRRFERQFRTERSSSTSRAAATAVDMTAVEWRSERVVRRLWRSRTETSRRRLFAKVPRVLFARRSPVLLRVPQRVQTRRVQRSLRRSLVVVFVTRRRQVRRRARVDRRRRRTVRRRSERVERVSRTRRREVDRWTVSRCVSRCRLDPPVRRGRRVERVVRRRRRGEETVPGWRRWERSNRNLRFVRTRYRRLILLVVVVVLMLCRATRCMVVVVVVVVLR